MTFRPRRTRLAVELLEERANPVSFGPAATTYDGQNATTVATGDLNNDGYADVALATATSGFAFLGDANGNLTLKSTFAVTDPRKILIADVNKDGNQDVILANGDGRQVVSYLGNGDGTFQSPVGRNLTSGAADVVLADFNGDGKLDAAVASNVVMLLLNDGSPTVFGPATVYNTNANGLAISSGDFNHDGHPDIVLGDYADNRLDVLLNNGDGTFGAATPYALASHAGSLQTGDFNHDGRDDIAVAYPASTSIAVLLANADGTFQPRTEYDTSVGGPGVIAVADMDHDGNLDLTVAAPNASRAVVFLGDGSGGFAAPVQAPTGFGPSCVVAGDINGDGLPDLIASNATSPGSVTASLNTTPVITSFSVSAPANAVAGQAFSVTVTAKSQTGATLSSYAGTVHFTSSDGQAVLPADYTFTTGDAGVHTFTSAVTLKTSGSQSVTVADAVFSSVTGNASVSVSAAAASTVQVAASATATAGGAFNVTLTAKDAFGNTATGYAGTVHFTSSDNRAALPADYTFTAGDAGVHTFSVTLKTAGFASITAADTNDGSITGQTFVTVNTTDSELQLSTSAHQIVFGEAVTFTAVVTGSGGTPTGAVEFYNATTDTFLGSAALVNGVAQITTTALTVGHSFVLALYTGDGTFRASSALVAETVTARQLVTVGSDDSSGTASVFDPLTGALIGSGAPFGAYPGGVKTASGDVNGDGYSDVILMGGPGAENGHVLILSGKDFSTLADYRIGYPGELNLAAGDVNGDGFADVVVSTAVDFDFVAVFSGATRNVLAAYSVFGGLRLGVTLAVGDFDGDGKDEVIAGTAKPFDASGFGAALVVNGLTGQRIAAFLMPLVTEGVSVAAGDVNGDGRADVIIGTLSAIPGIGPIVAVYDAASQGLINGFAAYPGRPFGVHVSATDRDGDGRAEVVTEFAGPPHLVAYYAYDPSTNSFTVPDGFFV
jgi:hypothetical protein